MQTMPDERLLTAAQQIPLDEWHETFGRLEEGTIFRMEHESGQTFLVKVASHEIVGDQVYFLLEIVDQAAGNA